jgi:hypothetical protein
MSHAETAALLRSATKLATGFAADVAAHTEAYADWGLAEREEQVHVDLAGTAGTDPFWAFVDIDFQHSFALDSSRRMSQLDRPHTAFGADVRSASIDGVDIPRAVNISAVVSDWTIHSGAAAVGCTLAICVFAIAGCDFTAVLHASFQGYGVPRDPNIEETE